MVGLCVTTVAARSRGRCRASWSAVVPPSTVDRLPRPDQPRGEPADLDLGLLPDAGAHGEVRDRRRRGQRAAVHAVQPALGGELAQVAPDGVLGDVELGGEHPSRPPGRRDRRVARIRSLRWAASTASPYICTNLLVLHDCARYRRHDDYSTDDPDRRPLPLRHRRRPRPARRQPARPRGGGLADLPRRPRADDRRVGGAAGAARRRRDRRRPTRSPSRCIYPTAERLLQHCDAVLRLPGASTGADQDVRIAEERGLPVFHRVEDIPGYVAA